MDSADKVIQTNLLSWLESSLEYVLKMQYDYLHVSNKNLVFFIEETEQKNHLLHLC